MVEKVIDEIADRRMPGPQAGVPGAGERLSPTPPIIIIIDEEDNHPPSDSNGGYPRARGLAKVGREIIDDR